MFFSELTVCLFSPEVALPVSPWTPTQWAVRVGVRPVSGGRLWRAAPRAQDSW